MDSDARVGMVPAIPGYQWIRPLGAGGFADVFLCRQELPSREVAVKVARRDRGADGEAGIAREADVMALVSGHPAVAQLYGAGRTSDGRPYLVMEYCPVANILDQVRANPMATDRALSMVIRMCGGAEMLHRAGYVHRDIKPSNIMINAYGSPVLTDFGVSEPVGADPRSGRDAFSVMWAPPEQIAGTARAHPTQDVWALGATLWTLLMGRSPFEVVDGDNSAKTVAQRVARGRVSRIDRPGVPEAVTAIVRRAMSLDPEQRFGSAAALGYALQTIEREMHRPVTEMKLSVVASSSAPASALSSPSWAALDAERTRARRGSFADGANASLDEAWAGNSTTNRTGLGEGESKRPAWVLPVLALITVLATAGLVVAMLTGGGHSIHLGGASSDPTSGSTSESPGGGGSVNDAGGAPPAPVAEVIATPKGTEILWNWDIPQQGQAKADQFVFKYVLERPGEAVVAETMRRNSLTTTAVSGENCLTVSVVAELSGRESAPVTQCVTMP